jgi:hypothetical protein
MISCNLIISGVISLLPASTLFTYYLSSPTGEAVDIHDLIFQIGVGYLRLSTWITHIHEIPADFSKAGEAAFG